MNNKGMLIVALVMATILPPIAEADPYRVTIYTADTSHAGTDANVFIQLFGAKGTTRKVVLDPVGDSFERGHWDTDVLSIRRLGALRAIKLGHDNAGSNAGWLPKTVYITNLKTGFRVDFGAGQWIGGKSGPRERRFTPTNRVTYSKKQLKREVLSTRKAMERQSSRHKKKGWTFDEAMKYIEKGAKVVKVISAAAQ